MSKTELAILGLLAERPMYGYEIRRTVKERWMDRWALISLPSIYSVLNRLKVKKLLEEHAEKIGKTPERKVYTLSPEGLSCLQRMVEEGLNSSSPADIPFWLAVAFIQHVPGERALAALRKRLGIIEKMREMLEGDRTKYEKTVPFNWYALIMNGLDHMQVEINQIHFLINHLEQLL